MKTKALLFLTPLLCASIPRLHSADRAWDGSAAVNNWTDAANWTAGVAPVAGDRLFFPPGSRRRIW